MSDSLVTLLQDTDYARLGAARSLLEAEGLFAVIEGENRTLTFGETPAPCLQVRAADAERAVELLRAQGWLD